MRHPVLPVRAAPAAILLLAALAAGAIPAHAADGPAASQPGAPKPAQAGASHREPEHRLQKPSLLAPMQRLAEVVNPEAEQRHLDEGDEGSPRAAVNRFLEAARDGRFAEAARYLDLAPGNPPAEAARSARRLKAVLDRHHQIDLARVSGSVEGDTEDGLPGSIDELTRIPTSGSPEPIRLLRKFDRPGGHWLFTRRTVEVVDGLFAQLANHWLLDRLPAPLLAMGPIDLAFWQWLALPLLLVLAFLCAQLLGRATQRVLGSLARRTATQWDDALLASNARPIQLLWAIAICDWLLPFVGLYAPAQRFVDRVLNAALAAAFFWIALRSVDVARVLLAGGRYQVEPSAQAFLGFGARFAKLLLVLLAVVGVLAELGYPVGSLLAGLGLGGLAFALAAQKTVENLFGALSIGLDQPFRVGDYVRIEGTEGTVETIGLRSTRIRTMDRTLVTIPNGRLAEMRAESFSARDRMRFNATFGLDTAASEAQVRRVLEGFKDVLKAQPAVFDDVRVHLVRLGETSLEIEVNAWFRNEEQVDFLTQRQEVLLAFLRIVEGAGTGLAVLPTRVVLRRGEGPAGEKKE